MDRIKDLYKNFSKSEARLFKTYLKAFHSKGENKPLDLLQLIEKKPHATPEEVAEKLYGDPKSKAFIMMKSRLYDKMLEFLSLSVNPRMKKDQYSFLTKGLIEIRRLMLAATMLKARRLNLLAMDLLEKALKTARECVCPELEIDILMRMMSLQIVKGEEFDRLCINLTRALAQGERDVHAIISYQRFYTEHTLKTAATNDTEKIRFLEVSIPELEARLNQYYSVRADYYIHNLKAAYYTLIGDYEACKQANLHLVDLVKREQGLRKPARLSTPYFQLGMLDMKFHYYDQAISFFQNAAEYLKPESFGYFMTQLMLVYCHIYKEELETGEEILVKMGDIRESEVTKRRNSFLGLYTYLKATIFYLHKDYQEAYLTLQEITELNFDKEGWITGIRIFEIMVLIDLEDYDVCSQKVENLRKHLARYEADGRSKLIFRFLAALDRHSFLFQPHKNEAELLKELDSTYPWKHMGHEIIRFDTWYKCKRAGLDYQWNPPEAIPSQV